MLRNRCLVQIKDKEKSNAETKEDFPLNSLEAEDMGQSILTLEEALQTFEVESGVFRVKLK